MWLVQGIKVLLKFPLDKGHFIKVSTMTCTPANAIVAKKYPICDCPLGCKCASGFSTKKTLPLSAIKPVKIIGSTYDIPNPKLYGDKNPVSNAGCRKLILLILKSVMLLSGRLSSPPTAHYFTHKNEKGGRIASLNHVSVAISSLSRCHVND